MAGSSSRQDPECGEKESKVKVAEVEEDCLQDGSELCPTGRLKDGAGPTQHHGHIRSTAAGDFGLLDSKQPEGDDAPRVLYFKAQDGGAAAAVCQSSLCWSSEGS